jgi:hypothetical protein
MAPGFSMPPVPLIEKKSMKKSGPIDSPSDKIPPASEMIDKIIANHGGWRAQTLNRMRKFIQEADPDIVEECKWIKPGNPLGVPVWSHAGIVCTGESYKTTVKLTFAKGAALPDPARLFNASLEGNLRRAIDIREGEEIEARAFKALIAAAIALNTSAGKAKPGRK